MLSSQISNNNLSKNLMIGNQYRLIEKIGFGSYGEIYSAFDLKSSINDVAIKFEKKDVHKEVLYIEAKALNILKGFIIIVIIKNPDVPHFAKTFCYGEFLQYNFLSMELLGPNLQFAFIFYLFSVFFLSMLQFHMPDKRFTLVCD
jgi:predicted Ser/Thr protein kinase